MQPSEPGDTVIVGFGAAVLADGNASGALRRRVRGALDAAGRSPTPLFLLTGGVGLHGDAEAEVMKRLLLNAGIDMAQIVCETQAHDTVSSVVNCARIIRGMSKARRIAICSDRYHVPRCVLLFRILGVPASGLKIESGFAANGVLRWAWHYLRECAAIVVDVPVILVRRAEIGEPAKS